MPLIGCDDSVNYLIPVSNFDYQKLSEKYNIIIISMPHTPVITNETTLNKQYAYVPNPSEPYKYDSIYLKDNYLDKYVERGNEVLKYLRKQK